MRRLRGSSGLPCVCAAAPTSPHAHPAAPAECVNTFDAHDDKVWALALSGPSGDLLASGGGDGAVAVWEDCTAADAHEAAEAEEEAELKQQDLRNALQVRAGPRRGCALARGRPRHAAEALATLPSLHHACPPGASSQDADYGRAAALAFEMRHPGRLLAVVRQALDQGVGDGPRILASLAAGMGADDLRLCLEYIRWGWAWGTPHLGGHRSRSCDAPGALGALGCGGRP